MYDLNTIKIGERLRFYRVKNGMTLNNIAEKIYKTKATVSKYEKDEIQPDIYTLLEICNVLDININQLFQEKNEELLKISKIPFKNKMYLYYLTEKKLITSILEIYNENDDNFVKLYNGYKDTYLNCAYKYNGKIESCHSIIYITFNNAIPDLFEKVQLIINNNWANKKGYNCFITGLTPSGMPVIKKAVLLDRELVDAEEKEKYIRKLQIDKNEIKEIQKNNAWILENKIYEEFFYDL